MDIEQAVLGLPGAAPAFGLPNAWMWSRPPTMVLAGALSADGKRLFRVDARHSFDETLVGAVLAFAREHGAELLSDGRPFVPLSGFSCPGWDFDTVTGARPDLLNYHKQEDHPFRDVGYVVFPAYQIEFSGVETFDEANALLRQGIRPNQLNRGMQPFLKMRYQNTRTLSRSVGSRRALTELGTLLLELPLLENAPGSFVEFENRHAEVWAVIWDGEWVVTSVEGERRFVLDDLLTWVQQQILR